MQEQRKTLSFEGEDLYIAIDVHLKSWNVTIFNQQLHLKTFHQPPSAEGLSAYLKKNYPGGNYFSVYESGFCGFHHHYKLMKEGIENKVVNAADVPTTSKEKVHKRDAVDSRKLARSLRSGELEGIYVPAIEMLKDRSLIRIRSSLVGDLSRVKQRIKSLLYVYGIEYPTEFSDVSRHWSGKFMLWLKSVALSDQIASEGLALYIHQAEELRLLLLQATRKIRTLSKSDTYKERIILLTSIPGIGLLTAMSILRELEDIGRFKNADHLASYIGLVPSCHTSGQGEDQNGQMTSRAHGYLRRALVESAWVAARRDPALTMAYSNYLKRMEANKAIVRIARKLVNRIYVVLKKKNTLC